jgi:ABC-type uncharacterized transport system substrate-binding protein
MLMALPIPARAQQAGKSLRIGFLDGSTAYGMTVLVEAFRQELRKLGWIEGKNITIDYRYAENRGSDRLSELAADLVRVKVDLIVVTSAPTTLAAKNATNAIPIVMTSAADPVGTGLVASLARPGGNVTGFTAQSVDLNTKRLEILKDAIPKLVRVGLLRQPGGGTGLQLKELRTAASVLKLKLEEIETEVDAKSLEGAFQIAKQKQIQGIITLANRSFFSERKQIVELATKHRLPAIYFQREFVDAGGLMSYGADYAELFRRSAQYVDKILKGTKPADLPVQQATKFEFIISLKASKQIDITLPYELLARANQVIQ